MKIPDELKGAFKARAAGCSKYTVGVVAVVGGVRCYANAPVIAGLGARSGGAGLVRLVVPEESRHCAGALLPEATFADIHVTQIPRADVVVAGMGLGQGELAESAIAEILAAQGEGRVVLDADALTILASWMATDKEWKTNRSQEFILTPHEGEAARLLSVKSEEVTANRPAAAREIARRYGATVVLKGRGTIVVSSDAQRIYVNSTGNPCMALGGMGDLLAGVIGARWAYLKSDPFLAAAGAVWLHGAASDRLIAAGEDPSIANTAAHVGALRAILDN